MTVSHRRLASLAFAAALLAGPAQASMPDMDPPPGRAGVLSDTERPAPALAGRSTLAVNLAILGLGSLWLALAVRRHGAATPAAPRPAAAGR